MNQYWLAAPEIVLATAICVVILVDVFLRPEQRQVTYLLSMLALIGAAGASIFATVQQPTLAFSRAACFMDSGIEPRHIDLRPYVLFGDRVTMVGSDIHKQNRQRTVTVIGIYDIGIPSMEKATSYISLTEAQNLFGLRGQSTEVQITLKSVGTEAAVVAALAPQLPGYEVESWANTYPELGNAVGRKNIVMDIFSVVIVMIAGIGILNLLLMAIYERTREIGLLGAMGLKPRQIATTFILEGALIGFVGVIVGVGVGLLTNLSLMQVGMDYSQFAGVTDYMALISGRVYPTLGISKLFMRALIMLVIAALAALIPAIIASRREPSEALHHV